MSETTRNAPQPSSPVRIGLGETWPIIVALAVVAVVAELVGDHSLAVGIGRIEFFPMVWGILIAGALSIQRKRPIPVRLQKAAASVVSAAVLLLVARLAFNVGPNITKLVDIGPALLLQEVGHLLGTIGLALPLAVLLRMGRSTVGATFSLDREPAFGMVSERFGPDSHEYRGVLAMYVFGTLFGALYITFLASFLSSARIFDPLALAMGAGVGSGSMMAAATGSIIAAHPADAEAITAVAAVSNLLTTVLGVYVGLYVALPLAHRLYDLLTRRSAAAAGEGAAPAAPTREDGLNSTVITKLSESLSTVDVPLRLALPVVAILGIATAMISGGGFDPRVIGAYALMIVLVVVAVGLGRLTRVISPIIWITTIGALVSSPLSPVGALIGEVAGSVSILSLATVMLTAAGLSIGKDIGLMRTIGWKIVPVGLVSVTASFALSAVIAEFALGYWS